MLKKLSTFGIVGSLAFTALLFLAGINNWQVFTPLFFPSIFLISMVDKMLGGRSPDFLGPAISIVYSLLAGYLIGYVGHKVVQRRHRNPSRIGRLPSIAKRIFLLIVYFLLTSSVIFITNFGEVGIPGTALAFASWSSLFILMPLPNSRGIPELALYAVYLAILFCLTSARSTRADNWPPSGVVILHASFPAIFGIAVLVSGRLTELVQPWLQVLFFWPP
jgi:hypothetical protein